MTSPKESYIMENQKNSVRPSVRANIPMGTKKTELEAPPTVEKDFVWYLKNVCGGKDQYEFSTHDEAYKFGWNLRDQHGDKIKVEISVTTVRVFSV
jgi:hypothetical protein